MGRSTFSPHSPTSFSKSSHSNLFKRGLVIACLNINSLISHIDDTTILNNEIHLSGYEIIRKDRYVNGRNGGGVCIYIHNSLNYHIRNDLMNDNLEILIIEISKPRSKPFLVGTWYRPPNSSRDLMNLFENTIERIDAENCELYLVGDINCNLLSQDYDTYTSDLVNIFEIYDLTQMITEPTRITPVSQTLIDLCITNYPEKISSSGVLPLGISDHSLIYIVRKISYPKTAAKTIRRIFNSSDFLEDLSHLDWDSVQDSDDPNEMWNIWSHLFTSTVDKHAPMRDTRIGKRRSPGVTQSLLQKMRSRDFLKKNFDNTKDLNDWNLYKKSRNEVNNILKQSKRDYFRSHLDSAKNDPKKTWKLINQLTSRNVSNGTNINKIEFNSEEINDTCEIAEAFNTHFTEIGETLANKIPKTDTDSISYLKPTNSTF